MFLIVASYIQPSLNIIILAIMNEEFQLHICPQERHMALSPPVSIMSIGNISALPLSQRRYSAVSHTHLAHHVSHL